MKCFSCTSRSLKTNKNSPALLKQGIEEKNNACKDSLGLKTFDILCFPFSIPSSQHILLFRQTLLLQILQMYRKLSLTNYSYQVQYSTSNLGHNKVSVLCRQLARHIHKYEELQVESFMKGVSPDEKMHCRFFGFSLLCFSQAKGLTWHSI